MWQTQSSVRPGACLTPWASGGVDAPLGRSRRRKNCISELRTEITDMIISMRALVSSMNPPL